MNADVQTQQLLRAIADLDLCHQNFLTLRASLSEWQCDQLMGELQLKQGEVRRLFKLQFGYDGPPIVFG